MGKTWIQKRKRDHYYWLAKKDKFRSRAAYKLIQIDKKYHIFKENAVVLDLGCAPGGWLQVARNKIGEKGIVLGVDIVGVKPIQGVKTIIGDITRENTLYRIIERLEGKADIVLSDISPKISGNWDLDHSRQIHLAESAFKIACRVLKLDGIFVCKCFQGKLLKNFILELKQSFKSVKLFKPLASRKGSSEIYAVAKFLYRENNMT